MKRYTFLLLIITLMIGSGLNTTIIFAQNPTPDVSIACDAIDAELRFVSFADDGVIELELENLTAVDLDLIGFFLTWPPPVDETSALSLQRITIGGENINDYGRDGVGTLFWAGDAAGGIANESTPSTTFWIEAYPLPAETTQPIYMQFDGIDGSLDDERGWTVDSLEDLFFTYNCDIPQTGGGLINGIFLTEAAPSRATPVRTEAGIGSENANDNPTEMIMLDDPSSTRMRPTEEFSDVEDIPTATPIQVAAAVVQIRDDVSGEVIGNGTIRVIAPESVQSGHAVRVELEVVVDNLYATPTPRTAPGTEVPRITSTPVDATEQAPLFAESGLNLYQRMGATLTCSRESFLGCDEERTLEQDKLINGTITTWTWFLSPRDAIRGAQDLRIDLWISQENLSGSLEFIDIWDHSFTITINPLTVQDGDPLPIYILLSVFIFAMFGGAVLWWRGRDAPEVISILDRTPQIPGQKKPRVFISYRRHVSWALARSIANSLEKRGANVFIDVDDINEGHFADIIEKAIDKADYVVPILAPGSLESEWVRREIKRAIDKDKNIVPLLMDGFQLDPTELPDEVSTLARHNAITMVPEFYQEAVDRLATRFLKL